MVKFWLQCVYVTVFVFVMLLLVSIMTDLKLFGAFDPVSQALGQFELTNQVFSRLREDPKIDERVVLVNIGQLERRELAREIQIISKYKPKVIGIDSYFDCEGGLMDSINCPQLLDTLGNLLLSDAIQQAGNVVLVSKLLPKTATAKNPDADPYYDSMEVSDPMFRNFADHGFANLPTDANYQEDVKYCSSLIPKYYANGKTEYAFSVKLAMKYDSLKAMKFLERNNEEELINFRGNAETVDVKLKTLQNLELEQSHFRVLCYLIDINDVMNENFDSTLFKNKIVIMGFLGKRFGDPAWEDKFFTPLNKSVAGRANPDMFGPVIHANSAIMILNEDYINQLEGWQKYAIATLLCVLTVGLFKFIDDKLPIWYDGLSVIVQIVQILLISGMVVWSFLFFNIKLDLTLSMAVIALVGPCYDIFKSLQHEIENRFEARKKRQARDLPVEGN
jgi:CHASE2 domain-containing sensor protein